MFMRFPRRDMRGSMAPMLPEPFACSRCLRRQPDGGTCEVCRGDCLFDVRSRRERAFIDEAEDRVRDQRNRRIHVIAVLTSLLIGAPIAAVVVFFAPLLFVGQDVDAQARLVKPMLVIGVVVLIGPAFVVEKVLDRKRTSLLDGLPDADRP
jgi:hypothetical protein